MDRSPADDETRSDLDFDTINTVEELARALRMLRRRHAHRRRETKLSLRELAVKTGYAHGVIGDYINGTRLPPIDRFDVLIVLFGATPAEQRMLARAHERVEESTERSGAANALPAATAAPAATLAHALPRDTGVFVGRDSELARLIGAASEASHAAGRVVVVHAIDGMPGVGKTTFAVHAGHMLADRFPDGQLFVDLHAHTSGQVPVEPSDALASLLIADGLAPQLLPAHTDERASLWRTRTAATRRLIILDNAASRAQVEPLLPAAGGCLVLITSRRRLPALDAIPLPLGTLPAEHAADLFVRMASRDVDEPTAVSALVELCGGLPLAIAILAGLFRSRPAWTVADLVSEVSTARDRLDKIKAEDRAVTAAFDLSYQYLPAARQRFFRRLGLHPGTGLDAYAAAALADVPTEEAARHLQDLYDDRLLDEPARGRYQMHDLTREYSRRMGSLDTLDDRELATGRLLDFYQHTATVADRHIARRVRQTATPAVPTPAAAPDLPDRAQALTWMSNELDNLTSCTTYADRCSQHTRVVGLTSALTAYLQLTGQWGHATSLLTKAETAAQHGSRLSQATTLLQLGIVRRLTSDFPAATAALSRSLEIFERLDDQLRIADAFNELGAVLLPTGDYTGAADAQLKAFDLYRALGDRLGQADALIQLGAVRRATDEPDSAINALQQAHDIYTDLGDQRGQADALLLLGVTHHLIGDYADAASAQRQALDLYVGIGHRLGQANARSQLGTVLWLTNDYPAAIEVLPQALDLYRDLGDRLGQANSWLQLGTARYLLSDFVAGRQALDQALDIYRVVKDPLGQGHALYRIGIVQHLTGDLLGATASQEQALSIYRSIGSPRGEASVQSALGALQGAIGNYATAATLQEQALILHHRVGNRQGQAEALTNLGVIRTLTNDQQLAAIAFDQALTIYHEIGNRHGEAEVLNGCGILHLTCGEPYNGLAQHEQALQLAHQVRSPLEEARALHGIGRCAKTIGDIDRARTNLRPAVAIFQRIGAAEAPAIAAELSDLP